jgi:predicted DNA-binding protein (MmcQ/YjbR family)
VSAGYTRRLRSLALSFPDSREDHPFGPEAHVFKVGGGSRMFAIMSDGPPVRITLKLSKEEREIALTLPYVSEAKYVGRYGWVTSQVEDDDAMQATLEWLRESYWMRAPDRIRESAWTSGEA